ncbi:hypothetical protein BB558_005477 [Smittium angustum]|uniref:Uncharacterized protein n=1 Tax=Smittium angustum TaxID=133377 RepID=A0A2U1J0C7_SMIAN|nr:hypothetical protein BB558_005477 [Smittium angustum]
MHNHQTKELLPLTTPPCPDKEDGLAVQRATMRFIFRMIFRAFVFFGIAFMLTTKSFYMKIDYEGGDYEIKFYRTTYTQLTGPNVIRFLLMAIPPLLGMFSSIFLLYKLSNKEIKRLETLDHYQTVSNFITRATYTWLLFYVGYIRNDVSSTIYWVTLSALVFGTYRSAYKLHSQAKHEIS